MKNSVPEGEEEDEAEGEGDDINVNYDSNLDDIMLHCSPLILSLICVCMHAEEAEPEEGGEKKASKRVVATWHPYGTAPDGTNALTI